MGLACTALVTNTRKHKLDKTVQGKNLVYLKEGQNGRVKIVLVVQ